MLKNVASDEKETTNFAATSARSVANDNEASATSLANSEPSTRKTLWSMSVTSANDKASGHEKIIVPTRTTSKPKTRMTLQRKLDVYSVTWFMCKNDLLNYPDWDYGDNIGPWSKAVQTVLDNMHFVKKWEFHCIPRIYNILASQESCRVGIERYLLYYGKF